MCDECDETFMTQSDLNNHVSTDHIKHQQCNECEESFICGDTLAVHKRNVHTRNINEVSCQTEVYDCDDCKDYERRKMNMK